MTDSEIIHAVIEKLHDRAWVDALITQGYTTSQIADRAVNAVVGPMPLLGDLKQRITRPWSDDQMALAFASLDGLVQMLEYSEGFLRDRPAT